MWCCLTIQQSLKQTELQSLLPCRERVPQQEPQHICPGVTPWHFGPSFALADSITRTSDMQVSCQWQELEEIPPITPARRLFLFPSPIGCQEFWLVAGIRGCFQVLNICRAEYHLMKNYLKNRNGYWIIQSLSLSFKKEPFPKPSSMTLPIFFQREKNVSFIWRPLWLLQYLSRLSWSTADRNLVIFPMNCWHSTHNATNLIFIKQYRCLHN